MSHTLSLSLFLSLSLSSLSFSPFSLSLSLSVPFSHSQIFSSSLHLYLYILLHILLDILLTFSGALNDIRRANTNENSKVSPENSRDSRHPGNSGRNAIKGSKCPYEPQLSDMTGFEDGTSLISMPNGQCWTLLFQVKICLFLLIIKADNAAWMKKASLRKFTQKFKLLFLFVICWMLMFFEQLLWRFKKNLEWRKLFFESSN